MELIISTLIVSKFSLRSIIYEPSWGLVRFIFLLTCRTLFFLIAVESMKLTAFESACPWCLLLLWLLPGSWGTSSSSGCSSMGLNSPQCSKYLPYVCFYSPSTGGRFRIREPWCRFALESVPCSFLRRCLLFLLPIYDWLSEMSTLMFCSSSLSSYIA